MTFLIIGGTGANGSHVVKKLVKQGETPVIFDNFPHPENLGEAEKKTKIIKGDITDFNQLLDTIKKEGVDRIVHMAWLWTHGLVQEDPSMAFKVNLIGTFNVLEAARILDVKKVVFTSSWLVYGNMDKAMPEDRPKTTRNIYGAGKLAIETWGETYADTYGLGFAALRSPTLYGPGKLVTYGVPRASGSERIDLMVTNSVYGKPTKIVSDNTKQQVLYIKDLANAVLLAAMYKKSKPRIFNVGTDEYLSIKEIAYIIKKLIPAANIEIVQNEETLSRSFGMDITRAREELGFEPQYTMESSLKDYIEWVRSNQSLSA